MFFADVVLCSSVNLSLLLRQTQRYRPKNNAYRQLHLGKNKGAVVLTKWVTFQVLAVKKATMTESARQPVPGLNKVAMAWPSWFWRLAATAGSGWAKWSSTRSCRDPTMDWFLPATAARPWLKATGYRGNSSPQLPCVKQ